LPWQNSEKPSEQIRQTDSQLHEIDEHEQVIETDSVLIEPEPVEDNKKELSEGHVTLAQESLREVLKDQRVPEEVRESLAEDYKEVEEMLERLDHGHLYIVVFGRVSVGKSALLNALLGKKQFSTSPLHGETKVAHKSQWDEYQSGGLFLVDTPGINEVEGEGREALAKEVANRADLILFVVDGDITDTELEALESIKSTNHPIILALNKIDRYSQKEQEALFASLEKHSRGLIDPKNIIGVSAEPPEQLVLMVDEEGNEKEIMRQRPPNISALKTRLWDILESEGKTLAALNASLFAGDLTDKIAQQVLKVRQHLGEKLIRKYCIGKGVAVAINPIPVADLIAAAAVDGSLIIHLSHLYGLPLTKSEAGELLKTIGMQMLALLGTVWAIHFVSSILKFGTGGFSTVITGGAQGAVAYYSTYVVGQVAERYLVQGKSWGDGGPKFVVQEIIDSLDRDSIIDDAKRDIKKRLLR